MHHCLQTCININTKVLINVEKMFFEQKYLFQNVCLTSNKLDSVSWPSFRYI